MSTTAAGLTTDEFQVLLNGPAGKPPAGVLPNFTDPPNLTALFILTLTVTQTLATLAVVLRVYTKWSIIRSLGYEDCG